jgi:MtrB/PioB family decaheme-associated outer membrane protein
VQDRVAVAVPCAPGAPPANCNTPAAAAAALQNRSIYNTAFSYVDIKSRRDTAAVSVRFDPTQTVGLNIGVTSTGKTGHQPWGASFAFNDANELPLPIDNRTNDIETSLEWANRRGMLRFAWNGSFFGNDVPTLVWDNPIRATDFNNGQVPPNGPYDVNGYSNGNGPAQGRMALWPDNSQQVVSGTALYKLPRRTSVSGTMQLTWQRQDEDLIPWTINSVINTPAVSAAFPRLAALPRATADAEVRGINSVLTVNSRPYRNLGFTLRYRYNDRDNRTAPFDATQYVRFDAVPEEIDEGISQQFDVTRKTVDANASYSVGRWGSFRGGYSRDAYDRRGRGFSDVADDLYRVSFDTISSQHVSLRASYEHGSRRGDGYIESHLDYEGPGGTQPGLRYYDEADRNRRRGLLTLNVIPNDVIDVNVTYSGGKDDFDLHDEACLALTRCQRFGLLSAETNGVTAGVDVRPQDSIALGAHYGYEKYTAFQTSRNANPPPDPSWFDATRDWNLDNGEKVKTLTAYVNLTDVLPKTEVRVNLDVMNSSNAFLFGGPRIEQLNTNTTVTGAAPCPTGVTDCFVPLPDVDSRWIKLGADVRYFFARSVGVGLGLLYEDQNRGDFATIDANGSVGFTTPTDTPRVDYLGGLLTGYGARPYRGVTTFVRVLYRF